MSDFFLEAIRAVTVVIIFFYLLWVGRKENIGRQQGWLFIISGFGLILFGMVIDITDNFPSLDKYVVIGDTEFQAFLEKVVGYLMGFLLLSIGFWRWMPTVIALKNTKLELQESHEQLEKKIRERTVELQQSKEQLAVTLQSIGDGVITADIDGNIVLLNTVAEKMTGWSLDEALGRPVTEVFNTINEKNGDSCENPVQKVFESRSNIGTVYHSTLIAKDGSKRSISDNAAPIINSNKNIIGVVLVFRDVSERTRTEEQVKRFNYLLEELIGLVSLEQKLARVTDTVVDVFDADFCRIWVIKPGDLCRNGCPHAEATDDPHVCHRQDRCLHLVASSGRYATLNSTMHKRVPFGCYKIGRIASGDIKNFWTNEVTSDPRVHNHDWARQLGLVAFAGFRLFSQEGAPFGVMALFSKHVLKPGEISLLEGLANNVSQIIHVNMANDETLKLELQLQQSQKMEAIGTLAGGIAHDFNNILGAILGYTDMAKDEAPEGSIQRADLEKVLIASNRAKDLVTQILTFSRQARSEQKALQATPVVKEAVKLLRSSIPSTIQIKQDFAHDCGMMKADPTQLHQIIMNLCTNAYQAMEAQGGTLSISLGRTELTIADLRNESSLSPGSYIQLTVADTGPGIDLDTLKNIFDPYFTTKEVGQGTGMGLAMIHGIVKNHDGMIICESKVGEGTSFHVFFPELVTEFEEEIITDQPIPAGNERILYIDDEQFLIDMGKQLLERLGYAVTTSNNSIEALEIFKAQPYKFDLVITDQTMPGMTGDMLAREIFNIRSNVPVILCSGYSSTISREKALEMGISEFVIKPIGKNDIGLLIRKVLDGV